MRSEFLPFSKPSISEEDIAAVADVLRSGWITTGKWNKGYDSLSAHRTNSNSSNSRERWLDSHPEIMIRSLKNKLTGTIFPILLFLTFFPFWKASANEMPQNIVVEDAHIASPIDDNKSTNSVVHALWGQAAMDTAYLGMWSYHFIDDDDEYQTTHNLIGFTYKGVFLGTFENSRNDRAWGIGLQRDIYRTTLGVLSTEIGYRLGMMYGYDKMQLFNSGFFPLLQLYSDVRYKNVGIQFSWGGSALTAGFLIRF